MRDIRRAVAAGCAALLLRAAPAVAQTSPVSWRAEAAAVGTTGRVLIIGAHPDDEDNALIAWLSLARHVETAYLSLTRGESGVNLLARERQSLLGMVRTAEQLEERKRDGAHQYFTRAYDFGHAKNDSALYEVWPRDSLLTDVVTVLRAFRPQVVITLFTGDTTDHDTQHMVAGAMARAAFALAGDSVRFPAGRTAQLGPWSADALYQLVDSASSPSIVRVDVGTLDRDRQRSFAELGFEIRQLQRTQPLPKSPPVGPVYRYLRRDSVHTAGEAPAFEGRQAGSLFIDADTSWSRFSALALPDGVRPAIDSISMLTASIGERAAASTDDAAIARLAQIVRLATRARGAVLCAEPAAQDCRGGIGDLALSLATTRDRATRALLDASGIVIDATSERETVGQADSVGVSVTVYNGGSAPVTVTRVVVEAVRSEGFGGAADSTIAPGQVAKWTGRLRGFGVTYPWWMPAGLIPRTWMYNIGRVSAASPAVIGEDRYRSSSARITMRLGDIPITTVVGPIVARGETVARGDTRHPLATVPRLSVLVERSHEYARAGVPFERLERAWVGSSIGREDTVEVLAHLPDGITTDSAKRTVVLPPYGSRNVFFRLRGAWKTGEYPFSVTVTPPGAAQPPTATSGGMRPFGVQSTDVKTGLVAFEYPHIPTQRLPAGSTDSVLAIDLRVPPQLRVAFVRAERNDQIDSRITELGVQIYPIEPATLGITDLSLYSTILIAPGAYAQVEELRANAAAVRRFAERGGTVVVLYGRDELLAPGVLPFPIAFDTAHAITALDPESPVRTSTPHSPLLDWPNRITPADFAEWVGTRARELPVSYDPHFHPALELRDDAGRVSDAAILAARVGKGMFIYTALSFDQQLIPARAPGAARLLVNLLSAAQAPSR